MKNFLLFFLISFACSGVFAATPNASYFVGGNLTTRTFTLKSKKTDFQTDYSGRVLGFQGGFRGNYTQIHLEYLLDTEFSSKNVDVTVSSFSARFDFFKTIDLFHVLAGLRLDFMDGKIDLGTFPSSMTPGFVLGAGAFLGRKISLDFTFSYSLPFSNSDVEINSMKLYGLSASYHF